MPIHTLHLAFWDVRTWFPLGQLPFAGLMLLLYLAGRRRGWPWRSSLLATAALASGLSLGALLLPSVLGAVGGGIALWLAAQRLLGLRRAPLGALALGLVAVIAVGRWGCLLNDCCFGRTTDLPWGIHYGPGSATFILHRALGWIAPSAAAALAVHPYPLYESLGLLVWLPVALWLGKRLRSEGALLLFTAAYDLVLRGFIDGTRAMVNVWWGLLGSFAGLNLFQGSLLCAGLAAAAAGVALERSVRSRPAAVVAPAPEPGVLVPWLLFAGLWGVGWLSDAGQTPFLHRVLLAALACAALALRVPVRIAVPGWSRVWLAPAAAAVLLVPLALHLERTAQASDGQSPRAAASHGWLYEVDHRRGAIVRIGAQQEAPAAVEERREALALTADTPLEVVPAAPTPGRPSRTWVGGGAFAGNASYRVGDSCNDEYTLYDRGAGGGWLQTERELSASDTSVFWLGGRGSALFENETKTEHTSSSNTIYKYRMQTYTGQLWGEWEHPNVSVGAGLMAGARQRTVEGGGGRYLDGILRPSFHLRLGFSFLGLDGGYCDRHSLLGPSGARIGLSGAIGRGVTRVRHPDDTAFRYFFGGIIFPGADEAQSHFMLGGGAEIYATPRLVVGAQAAGGDGMFALGYVRAVVGP